MCSYSYVSVDRQSKIVANRVIDSTSVPVDETKGDLVKQLITDYNSYMSTLSLYKDIILSKQDT